MRTIVLICRRELAGYLKTLSGYIIIASMLALNGLAFNAFALGTTARRSSEVVGNFFYWTSGFTMATAILLSMRLLAEERQSGTLSLLYSSPVRDSEIVLGKYLSALIFLGVFLLTTLFMPALVLVNGKVSWGHLAAGYFGLMLVGSATIAIGVFGSSLVKSQVLAAISSGLVVVTLLLGWFIAKITDRPISELFTALDLYTQHFKPFQSGLVHVRDVAYYLAMTYVFLFGATRVLEARRWR